MIIYPAIDLYGGKVVRLTRGDYAQMTVYSDDPSSVAHGFKKAGATALHIVDLQGARDGRPANFDVIKRIVEEFGQDIQVGGGIRTPDFIENYLTIGARRVILGTAAVSEPGFLREMIRSFGDAIAVSVDIKDRFAAINGWTELSSMDAFELCRIVGDIGVRTLICTDISKDGILGGTNIELYDMLRKTLSINLIASGGITSLDEIKTLSMRGLDGAIIGKAIYAGSIMLTKAIMVAKQGGLQ
jgi:phosphoribosylformimino-5-aminoimidazole carboxamide ribotide isomerase